MKKTVNNLVFLVLLTIIPTALLWLPFFLNLKSLWGIPLPQNGIGTVVANYDGPLYIVIAKTFYNSDLIRSSFSFPLPLEYYAAHFPFFPFLVRLLGQIISYPYSILIVTVVSSFLALYYFQKLAQDFVSKTNADWLTFIFALFPARWLIVRSVGSPEPLFIAAVIASIYYFRKEKYIWAGIWGAVAQATKSPAILLFVAYGLATFFPAFKKAALSRLITLGKNLELGKKLPLLLIPLALVGVFYIYKLAYGNFFAYFNSGDNIHLFFPPFKIFDYSQPWVNTFWLEEILFIYLFGVLGFLKLTKDDNGTIAWFTGIFLTSLFFVSHRDILRYALPVVPFIILGFRDTLIKRDFKIALTFLIIPIYLYSIVFISQNVMPISDWGPLL